MSRGRDSLPASAAFRTRRPPRSWRRTRRPRGRASAPGQPRGPRPSAAAPPLARMPAQEAQGPIESWMKRWPIIVPVSAMALAMALALGMTWWMTRTDPRPPIPTEVQPRLPEPRFMRPPGGRSVETYSGSVPYPLPVLIPARPPLPLRPLDGQSLPRYLADGHDVELLSVERFWARAKSSQVRSGLMVRVRLSQLVPRTGGDPGSLVTLKHGLESEPVHFWGNQCNARRECVLSCWLADDGQPTEIVTPDGRHVRIE